MGGRVAVNNDFAEVLVRGQKLVSYPKKVDFTLPCEFHVRSHAGMHKEKVPAREGGLQVPEKTKMGLWHRVVKRCLQFSDLFSAHQLFRRNPVGQKGFKTAQAHPLIEQTAIGQTLDCDQFVVPSEEHAFVCLRVQDQTVDCLA